MKRPVIASVFALTALLGTPVFAADLCSANLEKIENAKTASTALGEPAKRQFEDAVKAAEAAKGTDEKACIAHTTEALKILADGDKGAKS